MYSSISINNTERKKIGVPILKRTDEMITEFNSDYEKHYKLDRLNSVSDNLETVDKHLKKIDYDYVRQTVREHFN